MKSLKMVNFRQFKGVTKIRFAHDTEKNVTIILGNNTFGKTTLLQAFSWCFYQVVDFETNPDELLNAELANNMADGDSNEVEVEIELDHDGIEYVISRTQEYICKKHITKGLRSVARVSYKKPNGETRQIKTHQINNVINNILPKDLSSYFFFDTERVKNISTRQDVAGAVKGLLGLATMENAIKHLGSKTASKSVIGKFYGSMDIEGDARAKEALIRIQDAQSKREHIASQMETCLSEINFYEGRKEQLYAILRDNQTTASLQRKKEDLERRINHEESAQRETTEAFLKEFNSGSIYFYSQPLLKRASDFLCAVKVDDKGIKDLTAVTINDIINRGECICGTKIVNGDPGNEAYQNLKKHLAFVPPESIGNTVRIYQEKINSFSTASNRIYDNIKGRFEELCRSRIRIQDCYDELEEVSSKIQGKENMSQYELELTDVKTRLKNLQEKKERLIREDEACKRDIERYQKIYDGLVAVSEKNKAAMEYIMYAEEIRDWLSTTYKEKEDLIRQKLEAKVNDIFEQMYHGHRRVIIDKRYQVSLLSSVADKELDTGESEGLNRVKNFAFIAGLVALAKEKIESSTEEEGLNSSSEPYPLVMDAPFSNADEIHIGNISRILPEVAEQVIMFVMQKDWRYAEPLMKDRVGERYELDKRSETFTKLMEV